MKFVFGVVGALVLVLYIFPIDANEVETELPLNFLDLPLELRLDILEHLDFFDLIRVSKTHPENRNVIETIFRNVLKNREFRIRFVQYFRRIEIIYDYTDVARIAYENAHENFDEILEFFQYFGHCITKFDYWYDSSVHGLCEQVHKQIGKYVAESVNEITFNLNDKPMNDSLRDLIVPYPNCEVAKLWEAAIDAENLYQMFPAVQSLDLSSIKLDESLNHFPYLNQLALPINWGGHVSHVLLFKQTLELNPQIKHLTIWRSEHWDILKTVNKILPDLESLDVSDVNFNGHENVTEPLRFASVKVFKCIANNVQIPVERIPFEFGKLEEIQFNRDELVDQWMDIMMRNKNLRKITALPTLGRDQLQSIANGLPKLEEFEMYGSEEHRPVQDIVDFLQTAKQLKNAKIVRLRIAQCKALAEQMNSGWEITVDHMNFCDFARKSFD